MVGRLAHKVFRMDYRSDEVKAENGGVSLITCGTGGRPGFRGGEIMALHKIGCRDINRFHRSWKGPVLEMFHYDTVLDCLEASDFPNDSGFEYRNIYDEAWGNVDVYPCTGCNLKKEARKKLEVD